jgi:hypothetical protein
MRKISNHRALMGLFLIASTNCIQPVEATKGYFKDLVHEFFDELIPEGFIPDDIEGALENITQQVLDVDLSELLLNITIPEEMMGSINVDILFSEVFGTILSFFGVPGYQQYYRPYDSPFYADPVPYGSECQFCDGGFDKDLEFAGLHCAEWEIFAGFSQGEECSILRAMAVKHCRCDRWTDGPGVPPTCRLCRDKTQEDNLPTLYDFLGADRALPTLSSHLRCSHIIGLPAVDGEAETCTDIAQLSEYCGCGIEVPHENQCTLCSQGMLPQNRDRIVLLGDEEEDLTCVQLHNKLATKQDSLDNEPSCALTHRHLSLMLGRDVETYCGCPLDPDRQDESEDSKPIYLGGPCEPCESGYTVRPDLEDVIAKKRGSENQLRVTCQGWGEEVQTLASDDPLCAALRTTVMPGCCIPASVHEQDEQVDLRENQAFQAISIAGRVTSLFQGTLLGLAVLAALLQ